MNDLVRAVRSRKDNPGRVDLYRDIDVNDLRKQVGMVFQKPIRFR